MFRESRWVIAVVAVFAVFLTWLMRQTPEGIAALSEEGAGIEAASAAGFALCALAVWIRTGTAFVTKAAISVLMLALTARELDMDKRFFTRGLFKSKQYLKADVPTLEKVLSAALVLFILACFIGLIYRERHGLTAGMRRLHSGTVALAVTALLAVVAKSLDGIARKLEPFGIAVDDGLAVYLEGIEEVLEFGIMALLLVAILTWPRRPASHP